MARVLKIDHQKQVCDIIYTLYCINGAFYYSQCVKPAVKYAWIILNVIGVTFIVLVGTVGYLLTSHNLSPLNVAYVMWQLNAVSYTFIFTPSLTFYYRRTLEKLIYFVDSDFECSGVRAPDQQKYNTIQNIRRVILLQIVLLTPFVSLNIFDMLLAYEVEKVHDVYRYLYPFPFIENINSALTYSVVYAVQLVFAIIMCTVGAVFPAFIVALGCEFYNTHADMCARLERRSAAMTKDFENTYARFLEMDVDEQKRLSKSFTKKIIDTVKEYHKISSIKIIRPFIEIYYSVLIVCFFTAQLANVYIILVTDIDVIMKMKQFLMLAATNTIFFAYCLLGKIFEEINEIIPSAVYSTPWYYLQPEDRKTIYVFLCQTQRPTKFFAFGVYPVTMATFPRVMNVVYSYINLLRTSLNAHRI